MLMIPRFMSLGGSQSHAPSCLLDFANWLSNIISKLICPNKLLIPSLSQICHLPQANPSLHLLTPKLWSQLWFYSFFHIPDPILHGWYWLSLQNIPHSPPTASSTSTLVQVIIFSHLDYCKSSQLISKCSVFPTFPFSQNYPPHRGWVILSKPEVDHVTPPVNTHDFPFTPPRVPSGSWSRRRHGLQSPLSSALISSCLCPYSLCFC